MAVTDPAASATAAIEPWAKPAWPTSPPDSAHVRVAYGRLADELVVRFAGTAGRAAVAVAIETPDRDYVYLLADDETGAVVGVQVDDLLVFARRLHPGWARLAEPSPTPSVVAGFVADVAELFARHGAGDTPPTG